MFGLEVVVVFEEVVEDELEEELVVEQTGVGVTSKAVQDEVIGYP